jgi:hypothetical protein
MELRISDHISSAAISSGLDLYRFGSRGDVGLRKTFLKRRNDVAIEIRVQIRGRAERSVKSLKVRRVHI